MYKVLFADDEPYLIEGLNMLIDWDAMGIERVGSAEDGVSAFCAIKRLKPDIVIADIHMPGLDGLELLQKCKEELYDAPEFLILTGYGDLKYIQTAMRYGARGYLLKPINADELNEHIEMILSELSQANDGDAESDESISYIARDTFIRIFFGDSEAKLLGRAAFILGLDSPADEVSVILFGLRQGTEPNQTESAVERIKASDGINPVGVFDMGFSYAAYISPRLDEPRCVETVSAVPDGLAENTVILPPSALSEVPKMIMAVLRARQEGVFTTGLYNLYGSRELYGDEAPAADMDRIMDSVAENDFETAELLIRRAFGYISESDAKVRHLRGLGMSFMFEMYKYVQRLGMDCGELFNISSYKLSKAAYTSEVGDICISLLSQLREQIEGWKYLSDFRSVMDYIESNYKRNITLADIGRSIYIKPAVISKIVKSSTGMKFSDYLNKLRMTEACRLLLKTDMTISNIVSEVGYKDYAYFANKFRQFAGCLPSQYRKQVQHKK